MPDHQSPQGKGTPVPASTGREATMYTREDLLNELDKLWRDRRVLNLLNRVSARIWRENDPDELVKDAIIKVIRASDGSISKEIPLYRTIIRNMQWVALDYLDKPDALGPRGKGARVAIDELRELAASATDPNGRMLYKQVLAVLLKRAQEIEDNQRAKGRDNVLPLREYIRLRFDEGLEGEELRAALGLLPTQFQSVTRAAWRLVADVLETTMKEGRA